MLKKKLKEINIRGYNVKLKYAIIAITSCVLTLVLLSLLTFVVLAPSGCISLEEPNNSAQPALNNNSMQGRFELEHAPQGHDPYIYVFNDTETGNLVYMGSGGCLAVVKR